MPINYASQRTYLQVDASTKSSIIEGIKTILLSVGWSLYSSTKGWVRYDFTGAPSNGQTSTLAGQNYRFVTSLSQAYDVLIDGTAAQCAQNLADAINEEPTTKGTKYHSDTVAHTLVDAEIVDTSNVKVSNKTGGPTYYWFNDNWGNVTLTSNSGYSQEGGYQIKSAKTSQGLCGIIWLVDQNDSNSYIRVIPMSGDATAYADYPGGLSASVSKYYDVIANRHQFVIWLLGSNTEFMLFTTPYLRSHSVAKVVEGVSDNGGEFQVTTAEAHGLTTGAHVYISNAEGVTELNGDWVITVIDGTNYTLDGSTYASGYVADSARAGSVEQVSRCVYFQSRLSYTGTTLYNQFRNNHWVRMNQSNGSRWSCLNQYAWCRTASDHTIDRLVLPAVEDHSGWFNVLKCFGGYANFAEARLAFPVTAENATCYEIGELWDAFIGTDDIDKDKIKNGIDGHNWINLMDNNEDCCLWFATAPGSEA